MGIGTPLGDRGHPEGTGKAGTGQDRCQCPCGSWMNNMGTGCEGAALTLVSVRDRIGGCPQMEGCSRVSVPGGCVPKWQRLSLLVGWISQWVCVCVVCGLPLDVPGGCVSLWEGDITGCPQFLSPWWVSRCVTPWMVVLSWVHVPGWGWIFPVSVPGGCPQSVCVCPRWVSWLVSWLVSPCGALCAGQAV